MLDTRLLELNPAPAASATIRLGDTTPITLTHTTTHIDSTAARTAIVLAFTPRSRHFTPAAVTGFASRPCTPSQAPTAHPPRRPRP